MERARSIEEILMDDDAMDEAFRKARLRAIRMHQISGEPLVLWQDGQIVYRTPEELLAEMAEGDAKGA
jgi:hypothetical protein